MYVISSICLKVSSADNIQTVSTQISPDKMSGLIWIQTVSSDGITLDWKENIFENKKQQTTKNMHKN